MRVCLVSRELAPFGGGGIGTYALSMARALAASGHEVHVLTQSYPRMKERWRGTAPGIRLHAVNLADASEEGLYPAFPMRWSMAVRRGLERLHEQHRFEWIEFPEFYGEGYFALQAKRGLGALQGATCVVHLHTPSVIPREINGVRALSRESAVLDHMERVSIELADLVISPTRALLDRVERMARLESPTAIIAHPFELDWATVHPESNSPPTVLYFGRLEHLKGVDLLLEAFTRLAGFGVTAQLRMIGGDTPTAPSGRSMREYLQRRIPSELRSRILIENPLPRSELVRAISAATVCCFPSLWENFPNVCLEAMACGRPVVASDAGGVPEILEDGKSGVLFRSRDAHALAEALRRTLEDDSFRGQIAADGRARLAELCEPSKVVEQTVEAIRSVRRRADEQSRSGPGPRAGGDAGPRVSVVIPFERRGPDLEGTLASVRAQTFGADEVLLVHFGSGSAGEDWPAPIRVERADREGPSGAFGWGLARAQGLYVLPLEPGDRIAPTYLERAVALFERVPDLAYVTSHTAYAVDSASGADGFIPWGLDASDVLAESLSGRFTALFRRDPTRAAGGFDPDLAEDWEWVLCCALAANGAQGAVLPEVLSLRRLDSPPRRSPERLEIRSRLIDRYPELVTERAMRRLLSQAEQLRSRAEETAFDWLWREGRHAARRRLRRIRVILESTAGRTFTWPTGKE